jgi:membrane dipeptidase
MIPIIDLHCDTIMALYQKKDNSLLSNNLQIDINKLKIGGYLAQVFAMFVFLKGTDSPYRTCNEMIDLFYIELELNKDKIKIAYNSKELLENQENGFLNAILSIEEGGVVEGSIEKLEHFYNRGVRMICLNWNFINGIGHPNFKIINNAPSKTPNTELGLTEFGISMVKKMEELGMIVDVSHLSDKGFWDVYNNTSKPFIASHSNSRAVCNHPRNLTDEMIKALNSRGGVMGLNFAKDFINGDAELSYVDDIVKHALHIIEVGSIDVLAFGTDFDGIERNTEVDNASMMQVFYEKFKEKGLSDEDIEKIFYKNFLRVFEKVCG